MHPHNASDDDVRVALGVCAGKADGGDIFALELDRRLGNSLCLHDVGIELCQPCFDKFIDLSAGRLGGDIHGVAQRIRDKIVDKAASIFRVYDGVLAAPVRFRMTAEHHIGRIEADIAELAVRSEIVNAVLADCRDPADRSGNSDRLERIHPIHLSKIAVQGIKT